MIRTQQSDAVVGPMDKSEAQALTERIRNAVENLGVMVEQAHDRRAWKALGYATWEAYVQAEFGFTRQRSYQLLDQGRVTKALAEATGDLSTTVVISERDAREIKPKIEAVTETIKAKVEAGEEPAKAVAETVAAAREAKQERVEKPAHAAPVKRTVVPIAEFEAVEAERDELREERDALLKDVADLKAEIATFADMKLEYERGGFAEIIANKDEIIRVLQSRVASESAEKVKNLRDLRAMGKKLDEAGKGRDIYIDLDGGANG